MKKYASLNNKQCMTKASLFDLDPNEYSQGSCSYPFTFNVDRSNRSCDTLSDLSKWLCDQKKTTKDLNLRFFNIIRGISESKTLTKHILFKCERKFDDRKYNSHQKWNNNKCSCQKVYLWNRATCSWENGKYLGSIIDNSAVICDKIIEKTNYFPTKFVLTKNTSTNIYILLSFLLTVIANCWHLSDKTSSKKKHLLPYNITNNTFTDKIISIWREMMN